MSERKAYIGDSVYADHDGFGLVLTTENGYGASNTIYMEPEVWRALVEYVDLLSRKPPARPGGVGR